MTKAEKLDWVASHTLFKFVTPIIGIIMIGMSTIIGTQLLGWAHAQEDATKDNKAAIQKHCEKTENDLDGKVDNEHFNTVLNLILRQQKEDKEVRQEAVKTMQKIQVELGIIKERISKE